MNQFLFYWQYALRNVWRNRRWSSFAILSVAAGVATVVALRSLGLAIGDALTSNVRSSNHGDITLTKGGGFSLFPGISEEDDTEVFSQRSVDRLSTWVAEQNGTMSEYISTSVQVSAVEAESTAGILQFVTAIFIDPATYPPTQDIRASDPPNAPLSDLFQGGNEVVISENLAETRDLQVGDFVVVSGNEFIVRGIVPTQAEAGLRDLFSAFFGFVYFDRALTETLSVNPRPNRVSIALPEGTSDEDVLQAVDEITSLLTFNEGFFRTDNVPTLIEQNAVIADVTSRFVVVMGLGAMLLGGVGIINTMLVMVRRRTEEIAALKTFGLKGRQVAALFMAEAMILGFIGSLIGSIVGSFLSAITNAYGEQFIQQPLTWRIYPEALLFGLVLGMVVTGVFGVLPVLTAVRVRPGIILRPNETYIPAVGIFQSLVVIIFMVLSLGIIAGQIIGPFPSDVPGGRRVGNFFETTLGSPTQLGIIGVAVTLTILALLVGLLWIIVWIVGKLPSFGSVDLRLALRNLSTRRTRTATTLLAISAGMFALSSITFVGAGVRDLLQTTLTQTFGGNVLIFPLLPQELAQPLIDGRLDTLEGMEYRSRISTYDGVIWEVDGRSLRVKPENYQALVDELNEALQNNDNVRAEETAQTMRAYEEAYVSLSVRDTDNPDFTGGTLVDGRYLTLEDRGQNVVVVQQTPEIAARGIELGSTILLEINRQEYRLEVVGLLADDSAFSSSLTFGDLLVPPDTLIGAQSDFSLNIAQIAPENLNEALVSIAALPLVFPIDITFIDGIFSRFIDQFSALPILVGLLSLGAAAVIMANTVALATLERRRQIGILKAIGLKGGRVLRIMLLENLIVSLLGGLIGIGLSAIGVAIMSNLWQDVTILIPTETLPIAVALVIAAVLIGALATFLSANVAVRERVLNVLRYE